MKIIAVFIFLASAIAQAREPITYLGKSPWPPYEHAQVKRTDGSGIDVYLARTPGKPRPTIVALQGSSCLPLFMINERRHVSTMLFQRALETASERFNIVLIEKKGLRSFTSPPASEEEARQWSKCTEERGGISKSARVSDVVRVIRALSATDWAGPVHLLGHSEGADVATGAARALKGKGITTLALLSGAGNTRFFDYLAQARNENGAAGAAQVIQEQLELTGPRPPREYRGAPAARDISYAIDSSPLDDVKNLRIPIFVAAGDRDTHASVASTEVFVTELLRDRKQPLHYLMLPGLDHGYVTADGRDESDAVFADYLRWAQAGSFGRSVTVGLPE